SINPPTGTETGPSNPSTEPANPTQTGSAPPVTPPAPFPMGTVPPGPPQGTSPSTPPGTGNTGVPPQGSIPNIPKTPFSPRPGGTNPPIPMGGVSVPPVPPQESNFPNTPMGENPQEPPTSVTPPSSPSFPASKPASPPQNPDDRLAKNVLGFWEKNVGSLEKTPELKNAMLDMVKSGGLSNSGKDGLAELFEKQGIDASKLNEGGWLDSASGPGSWKWPELGIGETGLKWPEFGGNFTAPSAPTMPSAPNVDMNMDMDIGGTATVAGQGLVVILVLVGIALGIYLLNKYFPEWRWPGRSKADLSKVVWPVAPAAVTDRASLIRAFEFLSVQMCGDAARVWHHRTIAAALRERIKLSEPVAEPLADVYELCRYTADTEDLPADALATARRCLAHLQGATV
ncbi:MAG: hypothetical protein ACRCZF_25610, partial [Gemmataceae bacterium]